VWILDRSLVSLVGFDGFIGDVGEGVAVGHSGEVVFDRANMQNNTERTTRQDAVMRAAAAGRRRSRSTSGRAAKTGETSERQHRIGRTRSGRERRRCSAWNAATAAARTVGPSKVADGRASAAWSCA